MSSGELLIQAIMASELRKRDSSRFQELLKREMPLGRLVSALAYLPGVQLTTFTINIPLNNRLQSLNLDAMDESAQEAAREGFEGRWNRWNAIRTIVSCVVSLLLMLLVLRY